MAEKTGLQEIVLDGTKYVRADSVDAVKPIPGKRAVVVVDRGWIFAGDVTLNGDTGELELTRAVHVFSWQTGGFSAVVDDPKKAGADLRKMATAVHVPTESVIFKCPVGDSWGL